MLGADAPVGLGVGVVEVDLIAAVVTDEGGREEVAGVVGVGNVAAVVADGGTGGFDGADAEWSNAVGGVVAGRSAVTGVRDE
jgi:hypothetical protein